MGNALANPYQRRLSDARLSLLMIGLDAAGKTTIIYKLNLGEVVNTIPTIGFNLESVKYNHVDWLLWDVGGEAKIRPLWQYYYQNTTHLVFVVDSNDRERMPEARSELDLMLNEQELQGVPLLVFCNKRDLPNAMSVSEIIDGLNLNSIGETRSWVALPCCATNEDGLMEGLDWLCTSSQRTTKRFANTKSART
jgi:ADP-ribosylation factor 1/2